MNSELIINLKNRSITQSCKSDHSLISIIEDAGIPLNLQCGGGGFCGKCKVKLIEGTFSVNDEELIVKEPITVLSCCTKLISASGIIEVPQSSILTLKGQIVTKFVIPVERGKIPGIHLAVDIGTTTIAAILFDGESGEVLADESAYNQQMRKGDDVSARITYVESTEGHLSEMQALVVDSSINHLISEMTSTLEISPLSINQVAVSGNTVMSHIFAGLSPHSIGFYPFIPLQREYPSIKAGDVGVNVDPTAEVYIVPSISGYLGGDVVSDIYISDLRDNSGKLKVKILIDLGTNSEMVLSCDGKLFATSTAAGPAFEGGGLLYGSRAMTGAIENFSISESLEFECKTIGNKKAKTICGSGIIDFLASGYKSGLINIMGRYDIEKLKKIKRFTACEMNGNTINCAILTDYKTDNVSVSEYDIEQVLKAKAAIYSGLVTLLAQENLSIADIDEVVLSGGFAKYISIENAITIGMLPNIPIEKYNVIGNGSLAGAYLAIQQSGTKDDFLQLIDLPKVVNLNEDLNFEFNYIDSLMLPE